MTDEERAAELRLLDRMLELDRSRAVFQGDHKAIQRSIDIMQRVAELHGLTSG